MLRRLIPAFFALCVALLWSQIPALLDPFVGSPGVREAWADAATWSRGWPLFLRSLQVFLPGFFGGMILGVLWGAVTAWPGRRWLNALGEVSLFAAQAVPDFFAVVLIQWLFVWWVQRGGTAFLPIGGVGRPYAWVLPSLTLSLFPMAAFGRLTYTLLSETLAQPYIRTARAKGVPEWRTVLGHGLAACAATLVSAVPRVAAATVSNLAIVEYLYGYVGLAAWPFAQHGNPMQLRAPAVALAETALCFGATVLWIDLVAGEVRSWLARGRREPDQGSVAA